MWKKFTNELLRQMGYRIVRIDTRMRRFDEALIHLRRRDLRPNTVFDIGVAQGTPELRRIFHDSYHVLIEPTDQAAIEDNRSGNGGLRRL